MTSTKWYTIGIQLGVNYFCNRVDAYRLRVYRDLSTTYPQNRLHVLQCYAMYTINGRLTRSQGKLQSVPLRLSRRGAFEDK